MSDVTNYGGGRVEGCGSGSDRGRGEGAFCEGACVGDVDPDGGGLGARYADGGVIVVEVRSSTLFVCLGGWVKDAHASEAHVLQYPPLPTQTALY